MMLNDAKKKLRYQSWHRGCKETDDILGPFADDYLPEAEDFSAFEALLAEDDWDIYGWITGERETPSPHIPMITAIQAFQAARHE